MTKRISIIFIVLFFCFCQTSRNEDVKKIIKKWQGREILIPDEIIFKTLGRDTVYTHLWEKTYKIFTYIDSIGCSSCQLGLTDWKKLINICQQQKIDLEFVFVVHSSDFEHFDNDVILYDFDYPIIYDYHNRFNKLNKFPPIPYSTFLLDTDFHVGKSALIF